MTKVRNRHQQQQPLISDPIDTYTAADGTLNSDPIKSSPIDTSDAAPGTLAFIFGVVTVLITLVLFIDYIRLRAFTSQLHVTGSGNVGFGVVAPTTKLDMLGDATIRGNINVGSNGSLIFLDPSRIQGTPLGMNFYTSNGAGNESLAMQLAENGTVVITNLIVSSVMTSHVIVSAQALDLLNVTDTATFRTVNVHGVISLFGGLTGANATITYLRTQSISNSDMITAARLYVTGITNLNTLTASGLTTLNAGAIITGGVTVSTGGLTVSASGAIITGGVTVSTGGLTVSASGAIITGGVTVSTGGLVVTAGGFIIYSGGITMPFDSGGLVIGTPSEPAFANTISTFNGYIRSFGGLYAISNGVSTGFRVGPTSVAAPNGGDAKITGTLTVDVAIVSPSSQEIKMNITDLDPAIARSVVMGEVTDCTGETESDTTTFVMTCCGVEDSSR